MRHALSEEEHEWRLKISRGSRFENLIQHIAITLLWRRADIILSILMNFLYSSVFHYNRFSIMCQEKHKNFMYLHMDLQCYIWWKALRRMDCNDNSDFAISYQVYWKCGFQK